MMLARLTLLVLPAAVAALVSRRAMLPLAASVAAVAPSVAATTCPQDRCALSELLAPSSAVPARLRESLRLADEMVANWNALTSQCTEDVCMVTNKRIVGEYLSERSPLMRLASEGVLRDPLTLALVVDGDREAYARNARRFESAVGYASSSANLAQFDPTLPTYRKGSYVPKGLKDAQGNLLGTNLENARDFATDARDALVVQPDRQRVPVGHEHPAPQVKFARVQQERPLDVLLQHAG